MNTKNVLTGSFAKLFSCALDDKVYAQALLATAINLPGVGTRNVVYVATVNNSVYAFDADSARKSGAYWHVNLTPAGTRPPQNSDMSPPFCGYSYKDFQGKFGIVGTPVIDKTTGTIYLVSRSVSTDGTNTFTQYLHALDITTGSDKTGSPVTITAQVNGIGYSNVNGVIRFDPKKQNQRPGLLLLNGIVYIGYSSHCDWDPYYGWLLGYDATTLQQKIVYNTSPGAGEGGIWMSGGGPAADSLGNIYLGTGNGLADSIPSAATNMGESVVQLTPSGNTLKVSSYFTPYNYADLDNADLDFAPVQVMLIPNTQFAVTGSKEGKIYVVDRNNMGGYSDSSNNVLQSINLGASAHMHTALTYYKGTANEFVYTWPENSLLKAFPVDRAAGKLDSSGVAISGIQGPIGNSGSVMSVTSNGAVDSTAILWVSHSNNCDANQAQCPGILRAISAGNVTRELWNSNMVASDNVGMYAKFVCPTVANGKVYLPSDSDSLLVYGLTGLAPDTVVQPVVTCAPPTGFTLTNEPGGNTLLGWQAEENVTGYTVQYRNVSVLNWSQIATDSNSAVLPALSCGYDYLYQVATTCAGRRVSTFSSPSGFSTPACPTDCPPLPTRWSTEDIGNVGVAGSACYNTEYFVYTVNGSGTDIGGTVDAFRFAYVTVVGDEQIVAHIGAQDSSDPDNKAGIMIRESSDNNARNVFIGVTSRQGALFQYRSATGASTTINTVPGLAAPYWVKLVKFDSSYSGYLSPDGTNWTEIGVPVDLGFGANGSGTYAGFAVTSHNNAVLSTMLSDAFVQSVPTTNPLAVTLVSFTGEAINDEYADLQWVTAMEENSDHFEVQRSTDGVHFGTVLTVKAVGNSQTPQHYEAVDDSPAPGLNAYRLKEVDVNGNYSYSLVVLLRFGKKAYDPLVYPNPVDAALNIVAGQEPVNEVDLYDVSGRILRRLLNGSASSTLVVPCGNLASGIYLVEILTPTQRYVKKFVKR